MTIVHLLDSLDVGGAERIVLQLARCQHVAGVTVEVHALHRGGPLESELLMSGIAVVRHRGGGRFSLSKSLFSEFRRSNPTVVHCHNAFATIVAAPVARLCDVGSVVSTRHGLVRPPYRLRQELQFAVAERFCSHVVAVCEQAQRNLAAAPLAARDKITTIYNGATPAPLGCTAGIFELKRGFTFLQVGRLSPPKDIVTALRAFALAQQSNPALCLWFVGDGPLRQESQALAQSLGISAQVVFFGERVDVGTFLAAADAFLLSSRSEGLPVSQIEAMAAGLPMILTDVGGMPEIAPPEGGAILVPAGDVPALSSAFLHFADQAASLRALKPRIRAYYEERFTLERMAQQYMDLYLKP